jgi:hypothetical protein
MWAWIALFVLCVLVMVVPSPRPSSRQRALRAAQHARAVPAELQEAGVGHAEVALVGSGSRTGGGHGADA